MRLIKNNYKSYEVFNKILITHGKGIKIPFRLKKGIGIRYGYWPIRQPEARLPMIRLL